MALLRWSSLTLLLVTACAPLVDRLTEPRPRGPPANLSLLGCQLVPAPPTPERFEASLDTVLTKGRDAWRRKGPRGLSCAQCHGPAPLDFAVTAIADDAVTAHARRFADEQAADEVVGFLHALRRSSGLREVCAWPWHPLQPGGQVLEGGEDAYLQRWKERGLRVARGPIVTATDARAAWHELGALDLDAVPLPVTLPALSDVGSLTDWMSHAPLLGRDVELERLHDELLSARDEDTARRLAEFILREGARPAEFAAPPGVSGLWVREMNVRKQAAQSWLVLRVTRAVGGLPPLEVDPHERELAMSSEGDPCGGDDGCNLTSLGRLPGGMAVDQRPGDTMERVAESVSSRWWWLAWVSDPSLLRVLGTNPMEGAHDARRWPFAPQERLVLRPFVHAVRVARQQRAFEDLFERGLAFPRPLWRAPVPSTRTLLLDGGWARFPGWSAGPEVAGPAGLEAVRLRINLMRCVVFEQRAALQQGASVADRFTLLLTLDGFERYVSAAQQAHGERETAGTPSFAAPEAQVLFGETLSLVAEVEALISRAPEEVVPRATALPEP